MSHVLWAFFLTALAGLSTGLGALFILRKKPTNYRFLTASLGFSAGVMIYVSFVEILQGAFKALQSAYGDTIGGWVTIVAFFVGIGIIALIDALIPEEQNPHEVQDQDVLESTKVELGREGSEAPSPEHAKAEKERSGLLRTGFVSALAIGIHNFPEGLATFMAAVVDPRLGLTIAIAIAIHNIPEGIGVAVPIYFATGSKRKAFVTTFLSGLAEPVGGLVGYLVLAPYLSEQLMGIVFGVVAGIMVYISLDELLPASEKYGEHHVSIMGLIAGMAVMAVSLQLLN